MGESAIEASRKWHFHDPVFAKYLNWMFPAWLRPNHLTVLRFCLVPIVLALLYTGNFRWGIPLFLFAGLTDVLDGSMARVRGQITEWGIVYDPIADKLLICAALLVMALSDVTGGVATVLLAIELVLLAGNVVLKRRGIIQPANVAGKIKMTLEVIGLCLLLSAFAASHAELALWATRTLVAAGMAAVVSVVVGYAGLRRMLGLGRAQKTAGAKETV